MLMGIPSSIQAVLHMSLIGFECTQNYHQLFTAIKDELHPSEALLQYVHGLYKMTDQSHLQNRIALTNHDTDGSSLYNCT